MSFVNEVQLKPLKIVIVYDVLADMIRLSESWLHSVAHFFRDFEFRCRAWNSSMLRDPKERDSAAHCAAQADLIVFSARARAELPDHMKAWIQAWLPRKSRRRDALVAISDILPAASENQPNLRNYLRRASRKGGMEFFYKAEFCPPFQEVGA
jgi:hypothetical protein